MTRNLSAKKKLLHRFETLWETSRNVTCDCKIFTLWAIAPKLWIYFFPLLSPFFSNLQISAVLSIFLHRMDGLFLKSGNSSSFLFFCGDFPNFFKSSYFLPIYIYTFIQIFVYLSNMICFTGHSSGFLLNSHISIHIFIYFLGILIIYYLNIYSSENLSGFRIFPDIFLMISFQRFHYIHFNYNMMISFFVYLADFRIFLQMFQHFSEFLI